MGSSESCAETFRIRLNSPKRSVSTLDVSGSHADSTKYDETRRKPLVDKRVCFHSRENILILIFGDEKRGVWLVLITKESSKPARSRRSFLLTSDETELFCSRFLVCSYSLLWLGYLRNPFRERGGQMSEVIERPKTPVITFGTMGTSHSVRDYGAGRSGVNDTGECFSCVCWAVHFLLPNLQRKLLTNLGSARLCKYLRCLGSAEDLFGACHG